MTVKYESKKEINAWKQLVEKAKSAPASQEASEEKKEEAAEAAAE